MTPTTRTVVCTACHQPIMGVFWPVLGAAPIAVTVVTTPLPAVVPGYPTGVQEQYYHPACAPGA